MDDLGDKIAAVALTKGTPVLSADGDRIGEVEHVLYDEPTAIFDGIVIDTKAGPGGLHFADAPEVADIHERGVVLTLSTEACRSLPKPGANPAVVENHGLEDSESPLTHKLRRAWEMISGKG